MRQPKVLVVVRAAWRVGAGGGQAEDKTNVAASAAKAYLDISPAEEAC